MYNFYNIVIANDQKEFTLRYKLKNNNVAQHWAGIIQQLTVDNLRANKNPWIGLNTDIPNLVNRLLSIVDDLNTWMPTAIEIDWDYNDVQASVNRYHTHFPEFNHITQEPYRTQLSAYNDVIHEIEEVYRTTNTQPWPGMMLCPDTDLPVNETLTDFQLVQPYFEFGDLVLGYSQIGRHPLEIYWANDVSVPSHQIIPHNVIGPVHYLRFRNYSVDMEDFERFYYASKINWPYKFDDPKLAPGYIVLGKLETDMTEKQTLALVTSCNKVVNWYLE